VHRIESEQLFVPVQRTSHAHDWPHDTALHDCTPEHWTSQAPVPHCTCWHEPLPVHSTVQLVEPVQVTPLRHALSVSHLTSHDQPAGHATLALQFAPFAQSMMHEWLPVLQVVHCDGQLLPESVPAFASIGLTGASAVFVPWTIQNPSTHSRPSLQSALLVHA
jgi:hypothetical protein